MISLSRIFPAVFALTFGAALVATAEKAKCPIDGKDADPAISTEYEEIAYHFCSDACRTKFQAEREASLYHRLGGKAAIDAAVERFYEKVLSDERVNFFFDDVNMNTQRRKQKEFLSFAFGSPVAWTGKDMRAAHKNLDLKESDFMAIAENLQATLEELKIDEKLIAEVMAIAASTKDAVLNK